LVAGGEAEADEQVGLASAGVTEQDDGFPGVQVGPGRQVRQRRCGDGGGVEVEVREAFEAGELRFGDASGPAPFEAVVDLGGEDLAEVSQVGAAFSYRDLGQADGFVAHGRQVQLQGGGVTAARAAASAVTLARRVVEFVLLLVVLVVAVMRAGPFGSGGRRSRLT